MCVLRGREEPRSDHATLVGFPDPLSGTDQDGPRNADRIPAPLAPFSHPLGHRNSHLGSAHQLHGCAIARAVPPLGAHPSFPGGRWLHAHVRRGPLRPPLWVPRAHGSRLGCESRPKRDLRLSSEQSLGTSRERLYPCVTRTVHWSGFVKICALRTIRP